MPTWRTIAPSSIARSPARRGRSATTNCCAASRRSNERRDRDPMALRFFLDEQLRGPLWHAIQQHNAAGAYVLDVLRVGDPPAPPLGTADPDLILWGEANGRVLVTNDRRTMPGHLTDHLQ